MRSRRRPPTDAMLADALGPRARRQVRIASLVSALVLAGVAAVGIQRLIDRGQFRAALWEPFTDGGVVRFFLTGLRFTVQAALVAMVLAMVLGVLLALARLTRGGPLRWAASGFIEFFRAMPLILLIYFSSLAFPQYGLDLSPFWKLVIALVIYNGAVLAEIFRAGILSLDRGQSEAAYALGLGYWATMGNVVVPQAARRMVPAIVSQLVTLLKDTSLGLVIPFDDLLARANQTGNFYGNMLQALVVAAVLYMTVNLFLSRLARRLEVRQRRRYGAGEIRVEGAEELVPLAAQAPSGT
ncbi:MAG: amino acid ABC transporter permease [Actinomycetota bacterium]|nr:amino acid ABC transporter permease [Actinomycetota bacterium]